MAMHRQRTDSTLGVVLVVILALLGVGAAPTRTHTYVTGQTIDPGEVTVNEDNLYAYLQGGVDTYAAGTVNTAALSDNSVTSIKIVDDTILEVDLNAVDTASDEECLTFESGAGGDFEWQACSVSHIASLTELTSNCESTGALTSCNTITETTGANPVIMGFSGRCSKATGSSFNMNFEVDNTAQMGTAGPNWEFNNGEEDICTLTHMTDDLTAAEHTFEITIDSADSNAATFTCGSATGCTFWIVEITD